MLVRVPPTPHASQHQRMHEGEVDVGPDVVRGLVARQLPRWATLPVRRIASGGTDNALYRLGDDLAVRLPLHEGAVGGLVKELRWLPFFAGRFTLDIPEVVAAGEPDDAYPFPWAVMRWLDGGDALTSDLESLPDTAIRLGGFVRELRDCPTDDAPAPGTEGFVRGMPLARRDASFREWLPRARGLLDVDAIEAVFDDALAAPDWAGSPVWLHADLLPGNILVRGGRLAGVLDFGAMALGDPAYDVTAAFHLLDPGSRELFLEAVGRTTTRCGVPGAWSCPARSSPSRTTSTRTRPWCGPRGAASSRCCGPSTPGARPASPGRRGPCRRSSRRRSAPTPSGAARR